MTAPPTVIRVATWNIRAAIGPGEPFPPAWWRQVDRERLERIASIVDRLDADLVALQEVAVMTVGGELLDQPAELARLTGTEVRYAAVHAFSLVEPEGGRVIGSAQWGNALLSRLAFLDSFAEGLPFGADRDDVEPAGSGRPLAGVTYADAPYGSREARCVVGARVSVGSAAIRVLNAHLTYAGTQQRQRQVDRLVQLSLERTGPTLVMGDFNAEIGSPELDALASRFDDPFTAAGVPRGDARRRSSGSVAIDHVLSHGLHAVAGRVATEAGDASDHLPVVATFEVDRSE